MGERSYRREEIAAVGQFCRAVLLDAGHELIGYLEPGAQSVGRAWIGDDFVQGVERLLAMPTRVVWAGRHAHPPAGETLYETAVSVAPLTAPRRGFIGRYVLNHDQYSYVDKATVLENDDRYRIHPLPVLTAETSDDDRCLRGARTTGDPALIGYWARNLISTSDTVPPGFDVLEFDLVQA
ncbi:hypothetical protein [Nocardia sp. NPDC051463]|uniref:hypothetical protein n=1 Tax=Nocardia sp. NPDC051463 TaxID=3154845 RepID=UPI003422B1FF